MYIHMWSASSSESMALLVLSDAESDSDCPKDPLVFGREPANLKPRSRAGLKYRSTGSAQTGAQFRFFSISGGPAAKCRARAGTGRPAPAQAEAGDTATQGRPLMIVDLRLSALLAAQGRPLGLPCQWGPDRP